jgi:hypothetical protein
MSTSTNMDMLTDDSNVVANDLIIMFLALERIRAVWSSSKFQVSVMGDAYLIAMGDLWKENSTVDAKRFATFVNKCKEMLAT